MIIYAISLRGMTREANGMPNYIWATKTQVDRLVVMRNNPETRNNFICIGKTIFSPADIVRIEEKNTEFYGGPIPKYVRDRYLEDQKKWFELISTDSKSIVESI